MTELLSYTFIRHTIIGSLLASILCGFIGTYIVSKRLVFISGGITHASFGGIGIGLFLGLPPMISAAIFSVLSAFGIQWFSRRQNMREDSAIAIFWTLGMSIGIICSISVPIGNILVASLNSNDEIQGNNTLVASSVITFLIP